MNANKSFNASSILWKSIILLNVNGITSTSLDYKLDDIYFS